MILRPQRNFTVVRQIANHIDTGTYYVQAVIRDAFTDSILATLNLDDKGGQRFTKNWLVCPDPSGLGRDISIVTSVYTDSGYTTKSENYGDEENTHLVEDSKITGGGGGGGGIDTRTLRRILKEELEKAKPDPIEFPEIPEQKEYEMRWDEVIDLINNLSTTVDKISKQKVEFNPIINEMQKVSKAIVDKEVTAETDIKPILDKIEEVIEIIKDDQREVIDSIDDFNNSIPRLIAQNTLKALENAKFNVEMPYRVPVKEDSATKGISIDIMKLTK